MLSHASAAEQATAGFQGLGLSLCHNPSQSLPVNQPLQREGRCWAPDAAAGAWAKPVPVNGLGRVVGGGQCVVAVRGRAAQRGRLALEPDQDRQVRRDQALAQRGPQRRHLSRRAHLPKEVAL